ncbi:MAG TPA: hypothetical protein VLZ05_04345 [Mycobacterium sp.]|nr:hypothetical protein [Mycobacterium sp.]HUH68161.1 hypothetical protein [Mycobacterium sp.]
MTADALRVVERELPTTDDAPVRAALAELGFHPCGSSTHAAGIRTLRPSRHDGAMLGADHAPDVENDAEALSRVSRSVLFAVMGMGAVVMAIPRVS